MHSKPVYLLWVGALIGTVLAVAGSSAIALSMFATDCPWPTLWMTWGKLLVLTIPTCSATVATVLLLKHAVPKGANNSIPPASPLPARVEEEEAKEWEGEPLTLAEEIVFAAYEQARYYYLEGEQPTRRLFEQKGMGQALWSSGRDLLSAAAIVVDGKVWAEEPWGVIEATLDKMHPDHDRVWIRPLGSRDMLSVLVSRQPVGNRYTTINEGG